jgi:hypothetical protein
MNIINYELNPFNDFDQQISFSVVAVVFQSAFHAEMH